MAQITVAAVQMTCTTDPAQNLAHAEELVRQAAAKGAQIVLLPELFERPYFCQERRYEYYDYALPVNENPAVQRFSKVCRNWNWLCQSAFMKRMASACSTVWPCWTPTAACWASTARPISRTTTITRKSFNFTPGNTGFKVFDTQYGRVGVGICWGPVVPGDGALPDHRRG